MAKRKEWTLGELDAVFAKYTAALQQIGATPDVQGVMFDIDAKTNTPCARVVMAKNSAYAREIPPRVGELPIKVEFRR
jgi:hypothetical protein